MPMREICPKCHYKNLTEWKELDPEQKVLVERLPLSAEMPLKERKKHRFCKRCWYEETNDPDRRA